MSTNGMDPLTLPYPPEGAAPEGSTEDRPDSTESVATKRTPLLIQLPLIIIAALGLFTWVFHYDEKTRAPIADGTTIAWFALLMLASLLHLVKGFTLPGGGGLDFAQSEVKKRDIATRSSETFRELIRKRARLLQQWTHQAARLNDELTLPIKKEAATKLITSYYLDRIDDVRLLIARPGETVRVTIFLYDLQAGFFYRLLSNDETAANSLTLRLVGLVGRAFREGQTINRATAAGPDMPRRDPGYQGLVIVPIRRRGAVAGIIVVDRGLAAACSPDEVLALEALSDLLMLVLSHPGNPSAGLVKTA